MMGLAGDGLLVWKILKSKENIAVSKYREYADCQLNHRKFLKRRGVYAACSRHKCSRGVDRPIIAAFRAVDSGSNPDGSIFGF